VFDLGELLTRFEAALPDAYRFIEHLPEEFVPRAKPMLDRPLAELGSGRASDGAPSRWSEDALGVSSP
jgi:hypothetical protein